MSAIADKKMNPAILNQIIKKLAGVDCFSERKRFS